MKKKYEKPELQVIATEGVEQLMKISNVHTTDPKPGGDPLAEPSSAKNGVMNEYSASSLDMQ